MYDVCPERIMVPGPVVEAEFVYSALSALGSTRRRDRHDKTYSDLGDDDMRLPLLLCILPFLQGYVVL